MKCLKNPAGFLPAPTSPLSLGMKCKHPNPRKLSWTRPREVFCQQWTLNAWRSLDILDRHSRQVVTVIELLSPTNKNPGADRDQYLGKRGQLLHSPVHFVEIDLLRGGPRMPVEGVPPCAYLVMVSRTPQRPETDLWPIQLREKLPVIPLPLKQPDPDASIDLQSLVHRVYDAAGFQNYIYDAAPEPALKPEDAAWAKQFIPVRN